MVYLTLAVYEVEVFGNATVKVPSFRMAAIYPTIEHDAGKTVVSAANLSDVVDSLGYSCIGMQMAKIDFGFVEGQPGYLDVSFAATCSCSERHVA